MAATSLLRHGGCLFVVVVIVMTGLLVIVTVFHLAKHADLHQVVRFYNCSCCQPSMS